MDALLHVREYFDGNLYLRTHALCGRTLGTKRKLTRIFLRIDGLSFTSLISVDSSTISLSVCLRNENIDVVKSEQHVRQ